MQKSYSKYSDHSLKWTNQQRRYCLNSPCSWIRTVSFNVSYEANNQADVHTNWIFPHTSQHRCKHAACRRLGWDADSQIQGTVGWDGFSTQNIMFIVFLESHYSCCSITAVLFSSNHRFSSGYSSLQRRLLTQRFTHLIFYSLARTLNHVEQGRDSVGILYLCYYLKIPLFVFPLPPLLKSHYSAATFPLFRVYFVCVSLHILRGSTFD